MALDLLFGKTRRNWARGSRRLASLSAPAREPVSDEVTDRFTPDEMTFIAKLAETKAKAEGGDRSAKRQYSKMPKTIATLKAKAKRGDPKAKRLLSVIDKSGLFNPSQTLVITDTSGNDCICRTGHSELLGEFVGDDLLGEFVGDDLLGEFVGDDLLGEFVGDEISALSGDGGSAEKATLARFARNRGIAKGRCGAECGASIPNTNYRMAVYRQAIRQNNGKLPTTKDIFKAKSKVDQVIGKAGISLYLPGAKPGRRTI